MAVRKKAVFLDKDGTLINDVPFNVNPDLISLTTLACEGLRLLQNEGYALHVITNQPGIAKGFFDRAALGRVEKRLREMLDAGGVHLDGFYYCPHSTDGIVSADAIACDCRKPMPGLLQRAANENCIDLAKSWMVGDILNDVEAGRRAGCRTVLIDNGNETEWELSPYRTPDLISSNLYHAASRITSFDRSMAQQERTKFASAGNRFKPASSFAR
jgi:D-glycero-D-manno-heptose 1,7-bisphosphate phosphatase